MRTILGTLLPVAAACAALSACGSSAGELTSDERSRADAAFTVIRRHCGQVAGATVFVHGGGIETRAERRAHAAERRGVSELLELHADKPDAGYAPPGERIRPLSDVLGELSKQMLFCDSIAAARISQALDREQ